MWAGSTNFNLNDIYNKTYIMSKLRKPGKPKKNRRNVVKKLKLMNKNNEILSRLKYENNNYRISI